MSAAHDAHGATAAGHHASHDHDHFDNDPVQELPADEPRTPTWIPIVGLLLFFFAGTAWLLAASGDETDTKVDTAPAEAAPAAAAPQPRPQVQPTRVPPQVQARPAPSPLGTGGLKQLTPEQAKQIQERIEALRAKQQQPGGAPQPQPAQPVAK
ncbi:hypothetical protein [Polyangium spumosum]|uniref:Uncharacterized protein n=1 Tax=Polyangium spumosum TaxID=889282 RepID=A0A6N7PW59_9BACT|nr:hypothetical protein [Polyangium spumosum]MRG94495.1 hypothetical protein [Polyangium spumosum]